ncbi:hypothetical protein [Candidatus Cyanaurora vandensis]|uniref:hypothetical protein n=1 Tax=Candidatus Cyanaurora vandensis TaxID=2714958 RepID=UPI00257C70FD|nr:hypothetical protein [Candidatus Cyanaurora vandensis]
MMIERSTQHNRPQRTYRVQVQLRQYPLPTRRDRVSRAGVGVGLALAYGWVLVEIVWAVLGG